MWSKLGFSTQPIAELVPKISAKKSSPKRAFSKYYLC